MLDSEIFKSTFIKFQIYDYNLYKILYIIGEN